MSIYQTNNEMYSESFYMFSFGIEKDETFSHVLRIVKNKTEEKENDEISDLLLIDYISNKYDSDYRDNLLEI